MTMPAERHKLKRMSDNSRLELVLNAISDIDPSSEIMAAALGALSSLSSNTIVEEIDASDESVFEWLNDENKFEAWATIYVSLNYGDKKDHVSMTDSYPAVIKGEIKEGRVEFSDIDVDVRSFMD